MTENNPEPTDPFHAAMAADAAAVQAEQAEHEQRHRIMWEQQVRDAETTLDQRQALTRRVRAQASLLETLDVLVWVAIIVGITMLGWYGVANIIGAVR